MMWRHKVILANPLLPFIANANLALKYLILVLFVLNGSLYAQWRGPQLSYLGPEEGLHASVYDIAQDSTGYLYFATTVGLYRYDGHTFDFFGHDPTNENSIGVGDVYGVRAGRDGLIWLALRYGGLNSFNPKSGDFKRYLLPEESFRSVPGAHAIFEGEGDTLWVGALHFRLLAFDRKTHAFTTFSPDWIDPQSHGGRLAIQSIVAGKHDPRILWLSVIDYAVKGDPNGPFDMVSFDMRTGKFEPQPCRGRTKYMDSTGVLWGSIWGNLITSFDPASAECDAFYYEYQFNGEPSRSVSHDITLYHDQMLVATSKALLDFDKDQRAFEVLTLAKSQDEIFTSIYIDREENLWIGANQGTYILDPNEQHIRFFSLKEFGVPWRLYPGRLAYSEPDESIYLSINSGDLARRIYRIPLSEQQKNASSFVETDFPVTGLTSDHRDRIWVAGDGGFHLLDIVNQTLSRTSVISSGMDGLPWTWNLKSHPAGWIGAVGHHEFIWFHADTQDVRRIRMDQLPGSAYAKSFDNYFDGFSFGNHHRAYVFSNEIFSVELNTGEARVLKYDQRYNKNFQLIQYVAEDPAGKIWISTVEMVGRFHRVQDSLILEEAFTIADGMVAPSATEMHIDHRGRVWTFVVGGMNCIAPETDEVRYFGTREGLPDPFIDPRQVINIAEGHIATVNSNGVIVFDADALWGSVSSSGESVVIKQIRIAGDQLVSGQSVNYLERLELKPGQSLVDISFQAVAYPTDYRTEYSYRIIGLQEDWISIGQNNFVTLPSLGPGEYIFEVKAGNPASSAPVKTLSIYMATPVYKQLWFLFTISIIAAGFVYTFYRWRISAIRRQEEEKTEINKRMAELELKALRSQMNPHFMFNSLNSIKNFILQAEPKLAAEYLSDFSHLIRMILQNSREKSISLQDELNALILYIELEQLRFDEAFGFSCIIDDGLQLDKIRIPPMLLQPYVENAIWHGLMHKKEQGNLLLQFSKHENMVACIIEDDGVGRENAQKMKSLSANKYKSMGMGITQDRIEILNKMNALGITTEIIDKKDSSGKATGTRVVVHIPGSNELYM